MITFLIIFGTMILLALIYAFIIVLALSGLTFPGADFERKGLADLDITVIIPVRNESETIIACLESIARQEYPRDLIEVIISDDYSEDDTIEKIRQFIATLPENNWQILVPDDHAVARPGKKSAIERAVFRASGTLIVTTDADTNRGLRWLSQMAGFYSETGAKMILGPVAFETETTFFGKLQSLEFLGVMGVTAGMTRAGFPVMCNGANLGYEKEAFLRVDGFRGNEAYASGDDQFLLRKIKKRFGRKSVGFVMDRDAVVTTQASYNLREFFSQRLRWVSKSKGYRDPAVISTGLVTYLFQTVTLAGAFMGFVSPVYLWLALTLFGFKVLVDLPLVFTMAWFFGKKHLLPWYVPAQLFQVLYVPLTGLLAFVVPVKWKGRKV